MNTETIIPTSRANPPKSKRPTRYDECVLRLAAEKIAPKVQEWEEGDKTPLPAIIEALMEAIKYNSDGYEIAKSMEDRGWCPDSTLVDILSDALWRKSDALSKICEDWLKIHNLQPIPIDTKVTWPKYPEYGIGVVGDNRPDGRATVAFESQGQKKGLGYVIEWEELEIVP